MRMVIPPNVVEPEGQLPLLRILCGVEAFGVLAGVQYLLRALRDPDVKTNPKGRRLYRSCSASADNVTRLTTLYVLPRARCKV